MKIIKDRFDFITSYCAGKSILDLGAIGNNYNIHSVTTPWLHLYIKNVAKSVVGVDSDRKKIEMASKVSGTEIVYSDVENFDLNRKFDVVVAGELIEHINSYRNFFDSVKKHLSRDSYFILSTPNCFAFDNLVKALLFGRTNHHPGHVVYFDIGTLKALLESNGFKVEKYFFGTEIEQARFKVGIIRLLGLARPILNKDITIVAKLK